MSQLNGLTAMITGAGGGIGRAISLLLAAEGASIIAIDLTLTVAQTTASAIVESGGRAMALQADIADEQQCRTAISDALNASGRLDLLVNVAADQAPDMSPLHDRNVENTPTYVWDRALLVNVRGTAMMCKYALPHLRQTRGAIVNIASNLGLQGSVTQVAYSASKAAIIQLTRSIAASHGRAGIRCNSVSPGLTMTPSVVANVPEEHRNAVLSETLLSALSTPEDIAAAVLFLASPQARSITGHNLVVDGGTAVHIPGIAQALAHQSFDTGYERDPQAQQ